jgi:hypothetical protein
MLIKGGQYGEACSMKVHGGAWRTLVRHRITVMWPIALGTCVFVGDGRLTGN